MRCCGNLIPFTSLSNKARVKLDMFHFSDEVLPNVELDDDGVLRMPYAEDLTTPKLRCKVSQSVKPVVIFIS